MVGNTSSRMAHRLSCALLMGVSLRYGGSHASQPAGRSDLQVPLNRQGALPNLPLRLSENAEMGPSSRCHGVSVPIEIAEALITESERVADLVAQDLADALEHFLPVSWQPRRTAATATSIADVRHRDHRIRGGETPRGATFGPPRSAALDQ